MTALLRTTRKIVGRSLRSPMLAPLNDRVAVDRLLQRINQRWSLRDVRARVVAITPESDDACSVLLAPNRHWRGHIAGQHVVMEVDIDGVRHHRAFSLSSAPKENGLLRLTLRASARGLVSRWLQDPARVGSVLTLSQAQGEFVLPAARPERLLMIAGGSGISPLMAMLQQLAREQYRGHIQLLRVDRRDSDILLRDELASLQRSLPGLHIVQYLSAEQGRLSADTLRTLLRINPICTWMVCGPEGLMDLARALHAATTEGGTSTSPFLQELFSAPALRRAEQLEGEPRRINVEGATEPFTAAPGQTLLLAAEAAGLTPKSGCRAGICRSCLCQKRRGETRNLITGVRSDTPDEWIQLCISTAESDLELSL